MLFEIFVYFGSYTPSKADLSVFEAVGKAPAGNLPHVQRWYRHIASFSAQERNAWGGQALPQVAGAKPTTAAAAAADDDDVDLFASDEEEDAEAQRIREERLSAYNAKKSKKPALIAKSSVLLDVKPWDDEVIFHRRKMTTFLSFDNHSERSWLLNVVDVVVGFSYFHRPI